MVDGGYHRVLVDAALKIHGVEVCTVVVHIQQGPRPKALDRRQVNLGRGT